MGMLWGKTTGINITGDKELDRLFGALPKKLHRRALLAIMRRSAKPMVEFARGQAPKDTGNLSRSIGLITGRSQNPWVFIGPRTRGGAYGKSKEKGGKSGYYGWFIEYGASHIPSDSQAEFMQSTFASNSLRAFDEMEREINKIIRRYVKQAGFKYKTTRI